MSLAPTTRLEAVNEMMTAIGTTPVNSLDAPGSADVAIAVDTLDSISREVQSEGWWFNTSHYESLAPSGNQITVPANVLSLRPSAGTTSNPPETRPFVVRENKLYNPLTASFSFTSAVRADIVRLLDFEDLPESARRYIAIRAARIFQEKVLGDENMGVFKDTHERDAWQTFEGDHLVSTPFSDMFLRRVRGMSRMLRPDPPSLGGGGSQRGQR